MCLYFVGVCACARVCVLVYIGAVSVITTTYRGCNYVYVFCGGGLCACARACVCSSVYWGCFCYDNHTTTYRKCNYVYVFLWGGGGGCARMCVFVCIGVVSVMRTTYKGCNCVYVFCVSSFLRYMCFFFFNDVTATEQSFFIYDFVTHRCHLTIFFDAFEFRQVQSATFTIDVRSGMGVANEK